MSVLVTSDLTIEEFVEDDSRDHDRKADPPVVTYAVAESPSHVRTIRLPECGSNALD